MTILKPKSQRTKNLYIDVVDAIKKSIFKQEIMPGNSLPNETLIAQQMNVSRPIVREALRVLQIQGFLEVRRGKNGGTYVTDLSTISIVDHLEELILIGKVSIKDIIQARLLIEPELFRLATLRASQDQINQLKAITDKASASKSNKLRAQLNLEFHRTIVKIADNPIYTRTMKIIIDFVESFMHSFKPSHLYIHNDQDHIDILSAMSKQDAASAEKIARNHIQTAGNKMIEFEEAWLGTLRQNQSR